MRRKAISVVFILLSGLLLLFILPEYLFAVNLHDVTQGGPPIVTDDGVLFRYKDEKKNPGYVMVSGDFNEWENPLLMVKNSHNIFVYFYNRTDERSVILEQGTYRYRYLVDGVWMKDRENDKSVIDRYGTALSYFEVPKPIIITRNNPVHVKGNNYLFYYRDDQAERVFMVGDFNNWNPYSHPFKKNKSGIWEIELDLVPGAYAYRFIVDGLFRRDPLGIKAVHDRFDNPYSSFDIPLEQ